MSFRRQLPVAERQSAQVGDDHVGRIAEQWSHRAVVGAVPRPAVKQNHGRPGTCLSAHGRKSCPSQTATRIEPSRDLVASGLDITCRVTIRRAVPNIRANLPAETRDFFVDLLGFEVAMDMGWIVTVVSPSDPAVQVSIIGNNDPAAPGISVEVADVDAVHAKALERGLEIAYPLQDEEWGVRRFMLREPSGTIVNVLSHRSD